jgi:hypothetical protein
MLEVSAAEYYKEVVETALADDMDTVDYQKAAVDTCSVEMDLSLNPICTSSNLGLAKYTFRKNKDEVKLL